MSWEFYDAWNAAAKKENKPLQKRDYAYASELMMPKIDRFLKMNATAYTNPPNERSLRKFFAGNVWEYIVKHILITCGIYIKDEIKVDSTPFSDCIDVHGRLDFIAGGEISEESLSKVNDLPDFMRCIAESIIEKLRGKNLEERVLEIKSVSHYIIEYVYKLNSPIPTHHVQAYYYGRTISKPSSVIYISKDDALTREFYTDSMIAEKMMKQDLEEMTYFYTKQIKPKMEDLILFEWSEAKFKKNIGVEYSPYLSLVYGFESPEHYRNDVSGIIRKWNACLSQYAKLEAGIKTKTGKDVKISKDHEQSKKEISEKYIFNELLELKMNMIQENESDEIEK